MLPTSISFEDFQGLSKAQALSRVSFSETLEKAVSDVTGYSVMRNAVYRTDAGENGDEKVLLGLIPPNRPIIPYTRISEWICDELDKIKVPFKILESSVYGKSCSMLQKFIFDVDIENPDGFKLSPMLSLNCSYTGVPIAYELGTYRFICSNGASVGEQIFERKVISARKLKDFGKYSIGDDISKGLTKIVAISNRYHDLSQEDWIPFLVDLLNNPVVDVEFKKSLTKYLATTGELIPMVTKVIKNDDFMKLSVIGSGVLGGDEALFSFDPNGSKTGWNLYNDCTYLASHESSTITIRERVNRMIAQAFAA